MKKWFFVALAVLCVATIAFVGVYQWEKVRSLTEVCPAVETGHYYNVTYAEDETVAALSWDTMEEDLNRILTTACIRKGAKTNLESSPAFHIRLTDNGVNYLLVVGSDNTISVAQIDDLEGTRTFWRDCDKQVFAKLSTCKESNTQG